MISRRSLFAAIASLPFVGRFVKPAAANELNEAALEDAYVHLRIYAHAGEAVTCENGHPICEFVETVAYGQMQDPPRQLGHWRQPSPQVRQKPIPGCAQCGAPFTDGMRFHFADGWRGYEPSGLKISSRTQGRAEGDGVSLRSTAHPE